MTAAPTTLALANDAQRGSHSIQRLVGPPLEPADCVCCGEPKQNGRYAGLPVCFPCYETGLLREWLEQHNALDWPDDQYQRPLPASDRECTGCGGNGYWHENVHGGRRRVRHKCLRCGGTGIMQIHDSRTNNETDYVQRVRTL